VLELVMAGAVVAGAGGLWRDELPGRPGDAIAAAPARALGIGVDPSAETVAGRIVSASTRAVHLADRGRISAAVLVNATGRRRAGLGTEQTAYGLVVAASDAKHLVPDDTAVFMDWSQPAGTRASCMRSRSAATACYCRRPGWPASRAWLWTSSRGGCATGWSKPASRSKATRSACACRWTCPPPDALVRRRRRDDPPGDGIRTRRFAAAPPVIADALRAGLRVSARHALRAAPARSVATGGEARARVAPVRRAIRDMPASVLPGFFELFFRLPTELQCAFTLRAHRHVRYGGSDGGAVQRGAMAAAYPARLVSLRRGPVRPPVRPF
jgi:lycopene beta-cyclase